MWNSPGGMAECCCKKRSGKMFDPIEEVIAAVGRGELVVLVDDGRMRVI